MAKNTAVSLEGNRKSCFMVKLTYFFYIGGRSLLVSFLVVFLSYVGLSSMEIGVIRGIQPLIFFLTSPLLGFFSDKFIIHRQTLLIGITASALCNFSLAFLSSHDARRKERVLNCTSELTNSGYARDDLYMTPRNENFFLKNENCSHSNVLPTKVVFTSSLNGDVIQPAFPPHVLQFVISLILIAMGEVCHAGVLPVLDSNSQTLARSVKRSSYGQLRVWGSVGSIAILTVTGYFLDLLKTNLTFYHEYFPAFLVYLLCITSAIIPALQIPLFPRGSKDSALLVHLHSVVAKPSFAMFLLVAFVVGATTSQDSFKYLLLEELGASHLNRSLCIVVNCIGELPLMFFSQVIIDLIRNELIFCLTMVAWIVRLVTYSFLENPWLILPVELLNGICCGLWLPALTAFCRDVADRGLASSVLAVAHAIHTGIGMAAGGFLGGLAYDAFGPRILFLGIATTNFVMVVVYVLFLKCHNRHDDFIAVRLDPRDPDTGRKTALDDDGRYSFDVTKTSNVTPFKETAV